MVETSESNQKRSASADWVLCARHRHISTLLRKRGCLNEFDCDKEKNSGASPKIHSCVCEFWVYQSGTHKSAKGAGYHRESARRYLARRLVYSYIYYSQRKI